MCPFKTIYVWHNQRCQHSGIDVQIRELWYWSKKYGNQSLMIVKLSPIKISIKFQWQLSPDLINFNFILIATSF